MPEDMSANSSHESHHRNLRARSKYTVRLKLSKIAPSDLLWSASLHHPKLPKQVYEPGDKGSNTGAYRGAFLIQISPGLKLTHQ